MFIKKINAQSKYMIIKIIFCVFIFFITFPIKVNFIFYLNLLKNKGALTINLLNLIVLSQEKFVISDGELTSKNNRNEQKVIELKKDNEDILFIQIFLQNYFRKIILTEVLFFFDMGKKDDAFISTMGTVTVKLIADIILSILKTKKSGMVTYVFCNSLYLVNKISMLLKIGCYTNIVDLIFSFCKSKLKAKKRARLDNGTNE